MIRAVLPVLALSVTACTDDFERRPPDAHSHVASYWLPEVRPPKLDLLFVIDDTTAMAPYQARLAELAGAVDSAFDASDGGIPDLRIGVTTNGGALRRSPEVVGSYLYDMRKPDGTHETNFGGTLHAALASLLDVGAAGTGPSRLFDATERAIATELVRDDAYLGIVTLSATDDASERPSADYASAIKDAKTDPTDVLVSGIYPAGATRLDTFHTAFPSRSKVTALDEADWSRVLEQARQLFKGGLGLPCMPAPLDLDPEVPGDQIDCAMAYWIDGVEQGPLQHCGSGDLPCWELVEATQVGCTYEPETFQMKVHGFGDPYHPEVRGQCVVK